MLGGRRSDRKSDDGSHRASQFRCAWRIKRSLVPPFAEHDGRDDDQGCADDECGYELQGRVRGASEDRGDGEAALERKLDATRSASWPPLHPALEFKARFSRRGSRRLRADVFSLVGRDLRDVEAAPEVSGAAAFEASSNIQNSRRVASVKNCSASPSAIEIENGSM
jgi:hypothetical protein